MLYEGMTLWCFRDENGVERRFISEAFARIQANGRQIYTVEWHKAESEDPWRRLHEDIQQMDSDDLEKVTRRFIPRSWRAD